MILNYSKNFNLKKNYSKNFNLKNIVILNIFFVIIIFFFSFSFSKKLPFIYTYNYTNIRIDPSVYEFVIIRKNILGNNSLFLLDDAGKFIKEYMEYFNSNKNLHTLAPCPSEVLRNDLRNIQIYNLNMNAYEQKFNVKIKNNNIYNNNFNMDKCFNYIFVENLNKYFLKYIENDNKLIGKTISFLEKLNEEKAVINPTNIDQIEKFKLIKNLSSKLKYYISTNYSYSNDKKNKTIYIFLTLLFASAILQIIYFKLKKLKKFKKLKIKEILKFINS